MSELNEKQILILQTAEKLFAEKGFDGTSIRSISATANINVAMVSYYFGSKEKLLENLITYRVADLKVKLEHLFEEDLSPFEKIDKFVAFYIHKVNEHKNMHQILFFESNTKKRIFESAVFNEVKKSNLESLTKIINDGQQKKIFRTDVNIGLITPTIMGTYLHFQMNRKFNENLFQLETEADYEYFIKEQLVQHIQQTIKSLLKNEN